MVDSNTLTKYPQRSVVLGTWLFAGVLLCSGGCQWPLAYAFRDNVVPDDTTAKIALAPLFLPAYIILGTVDMIIVNPLHGTNNVPDVVESIWKWESLRPWVGYGALLPLKLVAIPPAVLGTVMFSEQFVRDSPGSQRPSLLQPK